MPRVLIVDDSLTARQNLKSILANDPDIEIAGQAINGEEAVLMTMQLRPDILTVDLHMPVLNGLDATRQIMAICPTPIVVVSASTLVKDVDWALKALQAGALTLLQKPPGPESPDYDAAAKELVETVKAMAAVKVVRRRLPHRAHVAEPAKSYAVRGPRAIAIAASTGGPPAIQQVLSELPADFAVPILITQHIAALFTTGFASWLDDALPLKVKVAEKHEPLEGGIVYVAPEQFHLGVTRDHRVLLSSDEPIGGFRPSATFLFDSVGKVYKQGALGVILTGMGNDGVAGLKTLQFHGGRVIAQDEDSCVVYGMPGAAKQAGVVNNTLPLNQIGRTLRSTFAGLNHQAK